MTTKTYSVAGQVAPVINTDTELLVVAAGKQFVASSIMVCNRGAATGDNTRYRIAVVKSGESLASKHYIRYEKLLEPTEDHTLVLGMTLSAGDKIVVRANTADLSFSVFGATIG